MKLTLAFLISLCIFPVYSFTQEKLADPKALELFIEGKTLELEDNYIGAIQKYKEALKIEKAAGIYFTLSKLYYNTSRYEDALSNALEALKIDPDNLDYKENAADVYIILNDYDNALKNLRQVYEKRPNDINIIYNIGRIYEVKKMPSEAIKYYEKITEDFQYDETVLQRMINIYEGYKDYANEAAAMEKLLTLNPTDITLKYSLASTYEKIPDYDNAIKVYDDILRVDPKNREVQTELIRIYFRQDRNDLAFEKFGKLINKDSVDYNSKIGIALAYYDAAKDDSTALSVAESILETVEQSYPSEWMPEFYLALIDIREGRKESAEQKLKAVLQRADTSIEAYVQVGFAFYDQNRLNDALNIFTDGVNKFPDDFRLNFLTGNTYYTLGKQKESLLYLEKALSISPSDINTLSTLGIIYDNLKMDPECEKLYEQAFKYYPDNVLLLNNYAYFLSERGIKLKEALEMSRKTIEKEPENSSYLDTYGWIFYQMKDYKNAKKYIEQAVKIGSNAVLLEHLGDVYEGLDDIDHAIRYWNESLKLDPNNKDVINKLAKYR